MPISKRGGFMPGGGRPKGSTTGVGTQRKITIDTNVWERIVSLAKQRAVKPNDIVRQAITEFLK